MADPADIFHFPRTEEARRYLGLLEKGDAQALTLFGPRRIGKTRFLLRDLAPLAEARRIRTVYASFWQDQDAPQEVLAVEIRRRLEAKTPTAIKKVLSALDAEASVTTPSAPGAPSLSIRAKSAPRSPPRRLLQLDALFEEICGQRGKALFLFDEVQQLAASRQHGPFIAQLRTSLDKRQGRALAIFTGSSESGLAAMFSQREAPMFRFGNRIELAELGADFIAHQHAALARRGVQVSALSLSRAFATLGGRPYDFEILRNKLIVRAKPDVDAALGETLEERAELLGFSHMWNALSPLHRAALHELASGDRKLFSAAALKRIGRACGQPALSAQSMQGAARALIRRGIIHQFEKRGPYSFVDEAFASWILESD
ncbi:MAG: ATP-binding protein [Hyphomonadaceae bacterium]|nr:ATP-binding protein [Hyphomonadaceae bacterium]